MHKRLRMLTLSRSCHSPGNTDWPAAVWQKLSKPDISDCIVAIDQLHQTETYVTGDTVAAKTCEIEYTSPSDIDGNKFRTIAKDAVVAVLDACEYHQGTYAANGGSFTIQKPSAGQKDEPDSEGGDS